MSWVGLRSLRFTRMEQQSAILEPVVCRESWNRASARPILSSWIHFVSSGLRPTFSESKGLSQPSIS